MSLAARLGRLREQAAAQRTGILADLAFAVVWVTVVTVLFDVLAGPQWAYHLTMAGGVVAYFGFFASLDAAREGSRAA